MKWKKHNERRCSMIKIQNLTAGYGKTIVLSHINLELKNETYGIIGPNGSGKTTLFRVLTNSLKLKSGHISKINGVWLSSTKIWLYAFADSEGTASIFLLFKENSSGRRE